MKKLFCTLPLIFVFVVSCASPEVVTPLVTASGTDTPTTVPIEMPIATDTPIPTQTPTEAPAQPEASGWLVDWPINEINPDWLGYSPWENGNTLRIRKDFQDMRLSIIDGVLSEPLPIPIPTPAFAYEWIFSPNDNYAVTCEPDKIVLYEMPGRTVLGDISTKTNCPVIQWDNQETRFSFSSIDRDLYIWDVKEPIPEIVDSRDSVFPRPWSPSGNRILTFVSNSDYSTTTVRIYKVSQGSIDVEKEIDFDVDSFPFTTLTHWVTDDIFGDVISAANNYWYYDFSSDSIIYDAVEGAQYPVLSPDMRWFVFDHSYYVDDLGTRTYELYNTETKRTFDLNTSAEFSLDFLDWSDDSSRFYAVSRPNDADASPDPEIAFGLVALEPYRPWFVDIVPAAMYAELNEQVTAAFVLMPVDGQLVPALYDLEGNLIAELPPAVEEVVYQNPGLQFPVLARWSSDGRQIVYADQSGNLWLADLQGNLIQLADHATYQDNFSKISWSPDDSHLLITSTTQGWVITLPVPNP